MDITTLKERGNNKMSSHNSNSSRRSKTRRSKVSPGDDVDLISEDVEMGSIKEKKNNLKVMAKMRDVIKNKVKASNPINMITNMRKNAVRWKDYATTRRKTKVVGGGENGTDRRRTGGQGLTPELGSDRPGSDAVDGQQLSDSQKELRKIHNRNLIEYFARLGQSQDEDACVSLEYIESLLLNGANINCTDKYGQSVLHEAARAWDVDVARFLVEECLADISQPDDQGRSPLHVAAAVDYPEMVCYLIDAGANKEARTTGEEQTPLHFAARNDACGSLKALLKKGCLYKDVRDYKGRTPLHVAAELDRSETARLLLELDDPAPAGVIDKSGQAAIVWMITKMPPVAKVALDQFHTTDRANRKQFYHLNWLEPRRPDDDRPVYPQTAIQVAVAYRRLDLIVHPVFSRLINIKWKRFGRLHAVIATILNLVFILSWTIQGVLVDYSKKHLYDLPNQWWRILLFLIALLLTVWQITEELTEYRSSKKAHSEWRKWRKKELERDMEYTHPRWPEEAQYIQQEIDDLDKSGPQYFKDFWNIFDWICYALLLVSIITHLIDVFRHSDFVARLHIRIMAITIILIWLRLMKNARAFSLLGPFIVIIGHMVGDVIKFAFLYLEFYIPFACAFFMIFGGEKVPEQYQGLPGASNYTSTVDGMADFGTLLFTLFRLTLVDEYDYPGLKSIDSTMTHLLLVSWFALSAILMLNLFIALMSDTFVRVYDKSNANAVMQKAITINTIEDGLSQKRRRKFREFIHTVCAPEKDFYDDDTTDDGGEDLKKVTVQIKEDLDELSESFHDFFLKEKKKAEQDNTDFASSEMDSNVSANKKHSPVTKKRFEEEMDQLHDGMNELMERQTEFAEKVKREMNQIKALLQQVAMAAMSGQTPGQAMDLNSSQVVARRPPMGRVGHMDMIGTPRSVSAMDFGQPSVFSATAPIVTRQSSLASMNRPPPSEEDWDNLERHRRRDLKQLREKLSHQQQLASLHTIGGRSASVTTDDEAILSSSRRGSVHTDTTVVQPGENKQDATTPDPENNC